MIQLTATKKIFNIIPAKKKDIRVHYKILKYIILLIAQAWEILVRN